MASFTVYDPKSKTFRALETASDIDLTLEQVLLINLLIEARVQTEYLSLIVQDPPADDPDELRAEMAQEIGSVNV